MLNQVPFLPKIRFRKASAATLTVLILAGGLAAAGMKKYPLRGKINRKFIHMLNPSVTADGSAIYYMVLDPSKKKNEVQDNWDIWVAYRTEAGWDAGRPLRAVNSWFFEGYPSVTADGNTLYFVANSLADPTVQPTGKVKQDLDIYYSRRVDGKWGPRQRLPEGINFKGTDENGATISPDGSTLIYFSEFGVKSRGGLDLYEVRRDDKGKWGLAKNLGSAINSAANETGPYLAADGKTLYFSSDRAGGKGGYDFYKSVFREGSGWQKPENLGAGVNSKVNEVGLSIAGNGEEMYLSGQALYGSTWRLFKARLPKPARPDTITLVKATVADRKTGKPIRATIVVEDLDSAKYLGEYVTNGKTGETSLALVRGRRYSVTVSARNYLFTTDNFDLKGLKNYESRKLSWQLAPILVGQSVVLKNIFFEGGSARLSSASRLALDKLTRVLKENPTVILEVGGHTAKIGSGGSGKPLSLKRAKAVRDYLVKKGVEGQRLIAKGYGASQPVATNATTEGRAKNRRTEFRVLKK